MLLPYFQWLGVLSFFTFGLSIVIIPWFIGRLPEDYFLSAQRRRPSPPVRPIKIFFLLLRNLLGVLFVTAGILMLFLPGQGILTILIGLLCMSFPGKQNLIDYLIGRKTLQISLNWTRRKMSRPPFHWQKK